MKKLEKNIKQWRKSLDKNEALEDGYKEELENHLRDKIEYLVGLGSSEEEAFEEAVAKIGQVDSIGSEYFKTDTRHISGRPPWKKNRWMPALIVNYFKIGFRKVKRQKVYSLINITGLAVGLACCAVIILYVNNELTYDTFHKDVNRIYRIGTHTINQVGEFWAVKTPGPLGSTIMANYPQVELAVRIVPPYENPVIVVVLKN